MSTRASFGPVSARHRLGAYAIDLILVASPLVVFFGLPERGDWGVLFALIYGVGSCVPLFLTLQGLSLFRRGRTLGMAYFGLEHTPRQSFGIAAFSGLQVLAASVAFGFVYDSSSQLPASAPAWTASVLFGLIVLVPNLLSIVLHGHRSLGERICRTRSTETSAEPAGASRAKPRARGYLVDVLLFALSLVPCLLLASEGRDYGKAEMLPALFTCGPLLVLELWALFTSGETIGTRAFQAPAPNHFDATHR